ncbi:NTF2-related export protein [Orchesella cincta]|uniref:NTF2-related export protein n=1 Tax=Orchesella cincta TaxID=48709 RepID=A0A1D2NBH0_ORCCI|nr:NTF2-related export protein [Orchesella cincta]
MSVISNSAQSGASDSPNPRAAIDEASKVGEDFVRLYYKTIEQRPHRVYLLYLDSAVVIWDGNPHVGTPVVQKLFEDLPSLTFNVVSMDAHPLSNIAVGQQKSFIINVGGSYRISGSGSKGFTQNFVVTAEGGKWKVASDVFRSQISPNQAVI